MWGTILKLGRKCSVVVFFINLAPCECARFIQPTRRGYLLKPPIFSFLICCWWATPSLLALKGQYDRTEIVMTVRAIAPMLLNAGLSKTAGCRKKSPPTCYYWPATLLGISLWMAFLNKISLDWPLTLTTQLSTSKLSDNPANGFFMIYW